MIFLIMTAWLLTGLYTLLILWFLWGWHKSYYSPILSAKEQKSFSLIIAIRNEEENLVKLLESINLQQYPSNNFEIILVDDHSTDSSPLIITSFKQNHPDLDIKYLALDENQSGKKAALHLAYKNAQYDYYLLTDGDCFLPKNWISSANDCFTNKEIKMLLGGVQIENPKSFIQKFQALEMSSLIASGAGAAGINHPILNNGANLAFKKEILEHINIQNLQMNRASGDDIFLLSETKRIYGAKSIRFKHENFVKTPPIKSLSDLLNQRFRWVSKAKVYKDSFVILTSLLVFLQNLLLITLLFAALFSPAIGISFLYVLLLKSTVDFMLLQKATKQKSLLKYYPLIALAYPIFLVYTAVLGQFISFTWKERKHKI